MSNKRNNELVEKVSNEILNNINVSEESKAIVKELLNAYNNATYKEWEDRHNWYRELVDKMVNDFSFEDDALAEKMANTHPTLQQSFFRMVVKFIKKMAEKEYCDARNEESVKLCKKLNNVLGADDTYIPFI